MLKIGKMTDYAMLILSEMAKAPDSILSANSLAEALYLSPPTVSKILKMLGEASLLLSQRGADGGYKLAKAANDISVIDVIAAMEGGMALTSCCDSSNCVIDSVCTMRDNWQRINKHMHSILTNISLHDMLKPLDFAHIGTENGK